MLKHPISKLEGVEKISLPGKVAQAVCKIEKKTISMAINTDKTWVSMTAGNVCIHTQPMDLDYPKYQQLVSEVPVHAVIIQKEKMLSAIKQASLVLDEGFGAKMGFNGGLTVGAEGKRGQYIQENVPFEKGKIEPAVNMRFNPRFVQDALSCMGEKVKLALHNEESPLFFYKGKEFTALIMPTMA
jgi:DNA polymerase III sliding clamp (beta) subunit (PCNA family)